MSFVHGKETFFELDATDISAYCDSSSLNRVKDLFETTTFGADDKTYIDGLREYDVPIGGKWDPTLDAALDGTDDGATVQFKFAPGGSGTIGYSGNAFLANYNIDSPVGGGTTWSASFKPSAAVTRTTQS